MLISEIFYSLQGEGILTGVPSVVDLAAMRDAIIALGGDANKINPLVPVEMVIDHSVILERTGTPESFDQNVTIEYERNIERYTFLKWAQSSFEQFRVVPPGMGICHQVNLEHLSRVVFEQDGVKETQNETRGVAVRPSVVDGFHVYGLHWSPTSIDFYIDGRLHQHLKNTSWHTPATMILDAETQVDWWGMPLDSDLPSAFTIDYVRAWKQAATTQ